MICPALPVVVVNKELTLSEEVQKVSLLLAVVERRGSA